jgi:hypothetical protein
MSLNIPIDLKKTGNVLIPGLVGALFGFAISTSGVDLLTLINGFLALAAVVFASKFNKLKQKLEDLEELLNYMQEALADNKISKEEAKKIVEMARKLLES